MTHPPEGQEQSSPAAYRRQLLGDPEALAPWLDEILRPEEVVEEFPKLAPSIGALKQMRRRNRGPRYLKVGSLVRYRRVDVLRFLESCVVGTAADPVGGFDD